jgi:hypothetical protein
MAAMHHTSRRHALARAAAVVLVVSGAGAGGCRPAYPPGLRWPPTPTGSIAATTTWRPIAAEPSVAPFYVVWTARGIVELGSDGRGAIYDPYEDTWRRVAPPSDMRGSLGAGELVSAETIVATAIGGRSPYSGLRAFDVKGAAWRSIPEPPEGVGISSAHAWAGSTLFLWGGITKLASQPLDGSPQEPDSDLGAILDVAEGTWRPVAREGAPMARANALAAWTGSVFFVWGGASNKSGSAQSCRGPSHENGCTFHANGAVYDPAKERWSAVPVDGAPPAFVDAGILWSGRVVLLWDRAGTSKVLYAYDPSARRWLAPIVLPFQLWSEQGVSGGRVLFLDGEGGHVLDVDTRVISEMKVPPDLRTCWRQRVFEPSRLVVVSHPSCHDGTAAVSAFEPTTNTWKTAVLPPLPRPAKILAAKGAFGGQLAWTGEHLIAWGSAYRTDDRYSRGCETLTSCHGPPQGVRRD